MQFVAIFTVLALAMSTTALPASESPALAIRTGSQTPTCSNSGQSPVCCDGNAVISIGLVTIPLCSIAVAGSSCSGKSACCNVEGNSGNNVVNVEILRGCNLLL
ncbi:hypothetical protein QBC44DRAFT_106423 [Cladorrhinum sp. PSN332]|nr:hypothetical protein QBC44DRAFT_106423 [Cladorrhinum sp. PSN332]